jgi:hypothetical protein
MAPMVRGMEPARHTFAAEEDRNEKIVRKLARQLPAWEALKHIRGFSEWHLGVIVGEAGDLANYSGVRKLCKRLGWAPDVCYPTGEKRGGRMIPRRTKGRLWGIIVDPLLKAQWAAERGPNGEKLEKVEERGQEGNIPGHPTGAYGKVYSDAKARHLESGKTKGHAHKLACRIMLKALLHDVHRAWHGQPLDYTFSSEVESPFRCESHLAADLPSDDLSTGDGASLAGVESHRLTDRPAPTSQESSRLSPIACDSQHRPDQPAALSPTQIQALPAFGGLTERELVQEETRLRLAAASLDFTAGVPQHD